MTTDRGKKDPAIHAAIAKHADVGVIFMHKDLRTLPRHRVLCALLKAEEAIEEATKQRKRMLRRLRPNGRLDRLGKSPVRRVLPNPLPTRPPRGDAEGRIPVYHR